ncbi:TatD family hydrolase [Candidatus Gracilibacteria bacterium]|nr:TatD family hydrolase [Candidatus Gracilibacteria bacterium]
MNYPLFDTHTHLYFPSFAGKLNEVLADCTQKNVKHQIQIGCDEITSQVALDMAKQYENFYCTLGLHPSDTNKIGIKDLEHHRYVGNNKYIPKAKNFDELFSFFSEIFKKNAENIVGFGETGFDLYHENSTEIYELQKDSFFRHLTLCEQFNRPFILHSRNAKKETLEVLEAEFSKRKNLRGIWHCFCEDAQTAQIATGQFGMFLGIGGILTYNNTENIREAVKQTPIEFLVTETDAPFLIPRKAKNKKVRLNSAALLPEVVELIAEIKNMEQEECAHILYANAKRAFGLEFEL